MPPVAEKWDAANSVQLAVFSVQRMQNDWPTGTVGAQWTIVLRTVSGRDGWLQLSCERKQIGKNIDGRKINSAGLASFSCPESSCLKSQNEKISSRMFGDKALPHGSWARSVR
jgi:hypothetical protein